MIYISINSSWYRITFNKLCKNSATKELLRSTAEILTFTTA